MVLFFVIKLIKFLLLCGMIKLIVLCCCISFINKLWFGFGIIEINVVGKLCFLSILCIIFVIVCEL